MAGKSFGKKAQEYFGTEEIGPDYIIARNSRYKKMATWLHSTNPGQFGAYLTLFIEDFGPFHMKLDERI